MAVRKIDLMHKLFGFCDGKCEECSNFREYQWNRRTYFKCAVYGETSSEASDWRKSYIACGMKNREYKGNPVIGSVIRDARGNVEEQIEGQMTLF